MLAQAPTAVSATPNSGSGSAQTFTFLFSHASGFVNIGATETLINGSLTYGSGCATHYEVASNQLYLRNDAGSAWLVPMTLGAPGTLQNSQCSIDVGASTVAKVGTDLTLNLAVTFKPAFTGAKTIYMWARDTSFANSDWQMRGSWTVPSSTPTVVSVTPGTGSAVSQTFSFLYSDSAGFDSLGATETLIGASLTYGGGCATHYEVASNQLYLRNDAGSAWLGPMTLGVAGTLQNNQCSIDVGASSVSKAGTDLTLSLAITFKPTFTGAKTIYMWARNTGFANTDWQVRGSWTVPATTPTAVSVTPGTGSGVSQTFSFLYSDAGGAASLGATEALINGALRYEGGCAIHYEVASNQLYLRNDPGSAWLAPLTLGSPGNLQNSQCNINVGASSVSTSGNDLTLNLAITYGSGFGGAKTIYMWARDTSFANTDWQTRGSWTVPDSTLSIGSISPSQLPAGSGDTTLFVNGSGFTAQSTVKAGGTSLATTFLNWGQLTAVVPSSLLTSAGALAISVSNPDPNGGTSNSVNLNVVLVVAVSPASASLQPGDTQQFTATVTGAANTVTWTVNDVAGGNSTVGTITSGGLYTAPSLPPTPNPVTVKATSTVDTGQSASAMVTVGNPTPSISSISPTSIPALSGNTGLTVNGGSFLASSVVELSGLSLSTTFQSNSQLTATIPASMLQTPGTVPITVRTPAPGGGVSNSKTLTIAQSVSVSPSTRTVPVNWTRLFTATVTGETDQSVTWMVNDVTGGSADTGTITAAGVFISPPTVPGNNVVTVKAVSVANPNKYGTAIVTITLPVSDNYPRSDATSILDTAPALAQVPLQGTIAAVLDWTSKDTSANNESVSKPEEILAVCHNLSEMGIPHIHTTDWATAAAYPMVAVAGVLEQNSITNTDRNNLSNYVQNGGTLLLWRPADSTLLSNLGVTSSTTFSGTDRRAVTFNVQTGDGAVRYIDDDVEVNWSMEYWSLGTTREYTVGSATAIATFSSGRAAIARSNLGTGRAYMFGWRLKNVMADAELQNIPVNPEPQWVNTQVLDADIARLIVRGIYETLPGSPHARQMAPNGKQAALILTHDVDARVSYDNLPQYLALENTQGVKSTYLFTTAPYDSGWVETMYNASGKANIQSAIDQGFDIQSHSFDHYRDFDHAPYGTGNETAANYFPHYSADLGYTINSSALGEVGVSRWLLRHDFGADIPAFRSGYLLMPQGFMDALQQVGYRRDSTYAAGLTRGFTPFVPFKMVNGSPVTFRFVEYPMGLEDRNLDATNVTQIVDAWEKVIRTNYKNGVPTVINIHPVNQPRIDAMTLLFQRIADLDKLWIGDWKTFGDFWESQGMTCSRWP